MSTEGTSSGAGSSLERVAARLIDGFVFTQLCYVATEIGVFDQLAPGPRTSGELAEVLGVDSGNLHRVLRGLAAEGVLTELAGDGFELAPLGELIGRMRGAVRARGELYYDAATGLLDAVRHGGSAFERRHGEPFFQYLGAHPEREAAFHASMATRAEAEAAAVLDAYDVTTVGRVVDVGGGNGILLAALLQAAPQVTGILMDRAAVLPDAQAHLDRAGVSSRARCVSGDFFDDVPPDGDTYVLSRVLHDWDDAHAIRILRTCLRRMRPDSRLLIVEAVLPERAVDHPAVILMDLHMLFLLGALERTLHEYAELLDHVGLDLNRYVPTSSPAGLAVIEARPQGTTVSVPV
jgi:SAM-dependent methyltransferase